MDLLLLAIREQDWDLKGCNVDSLPGWNNIYMEHINRLLDLMIVPEPNRRKDLNDILQLSFSISNRELLTPYEQIC